MVFCQQLLPSLFFSFTASCSLYPIPPVYTHTSASLLPFPTSLLTINNVFRPNISSLTLAPIGSEFLYLPAGTSLCCSWSLPSLAYIWTWFLSCDSLCLPHSSLSLLAWFTVLPRRWRQYVPLKHQWNPSRLHCIISQNVALFIVTAMRTWNRTWKQKLFRNNPCTLEVTENEFHYVLQSLLH
jgi:hypothetical protein